MIDTIDTFSVIPVRFHICGTEDGGFAGDMEVVPMRHAVLTQPRPTAVSFEGSLWEPTSEAGRAMCGWSF